MDIGLRLKLFRVAGALKQRDVAERLQVTVNFVSMVERGKRDPTLKYLESFSGIVGIPVSVLLWEPAASEERAPAEQDLHSRIAGLMAQYAASLGIGRTRTAKR